MTAVAQAKEMKSGYMGSEPALLQEWTGPYEGVPPWDKVKVAQFPAAFEAAMQASKAEFEAMGKRVLGEPRIGAHGTLIFFVHPKDMQGVLTEIMEVPQGH